MNEKTKKKNILDLQFQKYLIIASTSIIIAFTYFIGVGIAIITNQIRLGDFVSMGVLFIFSSGVFGICLALFSNAVFHLNNILEKIRQF
ncbi:MAG: hypothetical protein U9Q06_02060 [Nanoarchaeota archaeon]|nr:hypothetical protein [Nanoarchaeota archaeon]